MFVPRVVFASLLVIVSSGMLQDQCKFMASSVRCQNVALSRPFSTKESRPMQISAISIDSCDIQNNSIDGSDFHWFSSLNTLVIQKSSLLNVASTAFSRLTKLTVVIIQDTEWNFIRSGQFKNNTDLSILRLPRNKFTFLSEDTFPPNLTELDLSYNRITCISPSTFKELLLLQHLKLSGNRLTNIRSSVIIFPSVLKSLQLDNNNITVLEPSVFNNSTVLEELSLSFNYLCYLARDTFRGLRNLRILRLDNNKISELTHQLFWPLHSLEYLFLHGNKIENLSPDQLKFNSILEVHLDRAMFTGYLHQFPKLESARLHVRISELLNIVIAFQNKCADKNCDETINTINRSDILQWLADNETCYLKIPNLFSITQSSGIHDDSHNEVCNKTCTCPVQEISYVHVIIKYSIFTCGFVFLGFALGYGMSKYRISYRQRESALETISNDSSDPRNTNGTERDNAGEEQPMRPRS